MHQSSDEPSISTMSHIAALNTLAMGDVASMVVYLAERGTAWDHAIVFCAPTSFAGAVPTHVGRPVGGDGTRVYLAFLPALLSHLSEASHELRARLREPLPSHVVPVIYLLDGDEVVVRDLEIPCMARPPAGVPS